MCQFAYAKLQRCTYAYQIEVCYLETQALFFVFFDFRGAGGGAVQGTAAASCRAELAAFPKHLHLAIGALWNKYGTNIRNAGLFTTANVKSCQFIFMSLFMSVIGTFR